MGIESVALWWEHLLKIEGFGHAQRMLAYGEDELNMSTLKLSLREPHEIPLPGQEDPVPVHERLFRLFQVRALLCRGPLVTTRVSLTLSSSRAHVPQAILSNQTSPCLLCRGSLVWWQP